MATVNWSAIFLGNVADLDTNEGTLIAEGSASLLTTFGSAANPLSDQVITLQTDDNNGDGDIGRDNNATPDTITYETSPGGATQVSTLDTIVQVEVSIDFTDGAQESGNFFFIVQDTDGNLFFLANDFAFAFGQTDSRAIDAITVTLVPDDEVATLPQSGQDGGPFVSTNSGPTICFLPETHILTPRGEIRANALAVGDLVITKDNGAQPILWIGRQDRSFHTGDDRFKPYRIKRGALGRGLPRRNLKLSKQHRLLIDTPQGEHLAPMVGFAKISGVSRMHNLQHATFMNFLLPRHEIIFAEGTPIETLYLGEQTKSQFSRRDHAEIRDALALAPYEAPSMSPARPFLTRRQTSDMMDSHLLATA